MTDRILLRGGWVADGIGATTRRADVLIEGERIAAVRDAPVEGASPAAAHHDHLLIGSATDAPGQPAEVIDLPPGSVVCPGFIDAHAHAEGPLLEQGRVDGALAQGVTTLVVGQDGQSWIGADAATLRYLNRYFGPVNGTLAGPVTGPLDVAGYAAAVAGRLTQNVAVLASQGTIRHNVAGLRIGSLDPDQRRAARDQVERALTQGAVGLSSGLDYLPSRYGDPAEVAELARPLAAAGRPYVSHLRGYGPNVVSGLAELTETGRRSGARVHASHLWGAPPAIETAFAAADAADVLLSFDAYPYRRSSTILAMLLLPPELQAGGPDQTVAALADPGQRARLLAGDRFTPEYLAHVYLAALPTEHAWMAGLPIPEAAAQANQPAGGVDPGPAGPHRPPGRREPGPPGPHRARPDLAGPARPPQRRLRRHLPGPAPPPPRLRRLRPPSHLLPRPRPQPPRQPQPPRRPQPPRQPQPTRRPRSGPRLSDPGPPPGHERRRHVRPARPGPDRAGDGRRSLRHQPARPD